MFNYRNYDCPQNAAKTRSWRNMIDGGQHLLLVPLKTSYWLLWNYIFISHPQICASSSHKVEGYLYIAYSSQMYLGFF